VGLGIFNGYRSYERDPFVVAARCAEALRPVYVTAMWDSLGVNAALCADRAALEGNDHDSPPIFIAMQAIVERWEQHRFLDAEATLLRDAEEPDWLYLTIDVFGHDLYSRTLAGTLEFFPYWSNDPKPEGIALDDWTGRLDIWNRVIGWTANVDRSLVWRLLPEGPQMPFDVHRGIDVDRLMQSVPPRLERALTLALPQAVRDVVGPSFSGDLNQQADAIRKRQHMLAEEMTETLPVLTGKMLGG
jgi:hypothetical protein